MARRELTDADRERVRELHAEGLGRNEIAKQAGLSAATVTKLAKELELSFDRSATEVAVAARVVDAKAKRAELMNNLLDDAARLRAQLWERAHVYSFGGKDNTFAEAHVPQPSFRDQRDIMGSVSTALTASLRLAEHDSDPGVDASKSMLGALAGELSRLAEQLPADDPVPDDEP
ncbi:hypothetical protein M8C13_04480 [Crossiella sp. SN42]|uniref:hypothetical protein n=1 Tax=Crossiella sp. SN42 TaxID=2944808 RepID=UPI00207D3463|nr:hypothetical protein [Crossiella sp. SN42]MCO1575015.1 hypothetical protein [Crossiella sp. SN42]